MQKKTKKFVALEKELYGKSNKNLCLYFSDATGWLLQFNLYNLKRY